MSDTDSKAPGNSSETDGSSAALADTELGIAGGGAEVNFASDTDLSSEDESDEEMAAPTGPRAPPARRWFRRWETFLGDRYFAADPRWLGVWRIALGLLLCVEVLRRWYYARAFYTNDGILPNHFSLFAPMGRDIFSIYHAFSTMGEVSVAFFLTLIVFLLFTVGYKTRLFHILSAICITSLDVRNLFVENGGVVVVNIMTVYTVFLPMGQRFSVDAFRRSWRAKTDKTALDLNEGRDRVRPVAPVYSLMVLLFLMQFAAIYFFNAVHKGGENWRNGTAFYWYLHQDRIVTAFGVWMRERTPLLVYQALTWGTFVLEGALPILILSPIQQKWTRRVAIIFIFVLHGGIALTSRIGPFSYIMGLFPFLLLGREDWQQIERWFARESRKRTVVFDGTSALSFFLCRVLSRLDPFDCLELVDSRDEARVPGELDRDKLSAPFVVFRAGSIQAQYHEVALGEAIAALPFGAFLAFWLRVPGFSALARWVLLRAGQRREAWASYWGLTEVAEEPSLAGQAIPDVAVPGDLQLRTTKVLRTLREAAVFVLFASVAAQAIVQNQYASRRLPLIVDLINKYRPEAFIELFEYPRLLQGWGMFSPEAPYDDGRLVVDGRTKDGRKLDPLTGEAPDFSLHAERSWGHEQFWCDYQNRIRHRNHTGNRPHLKDYLLNHHTFAGKPDDALVAFEVWWLEDRSPPPNEKLETPLPPSKLLSHGTVRDPGIAPWLAATRKQPGRRDNP